jgi:acyl-CoA dehydrogenase
VRAFLQDPPRLGNQLHDDRVLRSYLARVLPPEVRREVEPSLANDEPLAPEEDATG